MIKKKKNNPRSHSNATPYLDPTQIRKQAEQKAGAIALPDLDNMTHEEILQMVHEMKVKQIEANLQIEHLRSGLEENNDQASLFSIVTENMLDMVALTDMDGNFTFAGKSHEILGYEPAFLIGKNVMDFVHPEDLPGILEEFAEFVTSGHPRKVEYRNRCKDDTYIWLETQGNLIKDENGVSQKIIFNSRDITERKRSEEKLRASEEKYRRIAENISDVVWIMGLDMRLSYVSPSVEKMVGESVAAHMNRTIEERLTPDSMEKIYAFFTEELEKENDPSVDKIRSREIEVEHYRADNTKFWVSVNASFLRDENGNPIGIQGVTRDITERKQEEEKLRKIYNNTHDAIIIHDRNGKIIDVNNRMCQIYNLSKEEAIACTIQDISSPVMSVQNLSKIWKKVLNDENQFFEWEAFSPNYRSIFYVEVSLAKIDHYNECFIIANIRDITQRKQQENALRQSENYYRTIFETSGSAMFIIDDDTTISLVNSNFVELAGYLPREIEGKKSWTEFVHPDDLAWMRENHYLRRHNPDAVPPLYEFRFITRHKELRYILLSVGMIPGTDQRVASCTDITERRRTEEALQANYELLQIAGETAKFGGWTVDLENNICTWSEVVADIHAMPHGHVQPLQEAINFYAPEWREKITQAFNACAEKGIPYDDEMEIITTTGKRVWVRVTGKAVGSDKGSISKVQGSCQDITYQKQTEQKLVEQKELLTAIYRNAPLVMMVVDAERRIQQVNGFAAQFSGKSVEEMIGLRGGEALRCLHVLDDPKGCGFGEYCQQCVIRNLVLDTLETNKTHLQIEAPYYFKGENSEIREMTFLTSTTPIMAKDVCMVLVTLQDITDRKRAESDR